MMLRLTAPHFVAGVILNEGLVTEAAPVVGYMLGWPFPRVRAYAISKRWNVEEMTDEYVDE